MMTYHRRERLVAGRSLAPQLPKRLGCTTLILLYFFLYLHPRHSNRARGACYLNMCGVGMCPGQVKVPTVSVTLTMAAQPFYMLNQGHHLTGGFPTLAHCPLPIAYLPRLLRAAGLSRGGPTRTW